MKKKITLIIFTALLLSAGMSFSQTWNYVNSTGTSFILYGMSFPPGQSTIGYACGMQYTYDAPGVIVKTVDGGDNWTQIWPVSGAIDGLQGIWFTSDLVGFACGWNNYFIRTTDGGSTWTPITVGANVWYYVDVVFRDASNGVAAASMNNPGDQAVFITSDGGNTWVPASSGVATNELMGLSYADQNTVYAVGTGANVFKSTDGGHNWNIISTLSAMLFGVDFVNANFGVAGGEEKMFATNSGGSTWITYTTGYENFYATKAFTNGTAYVGGTDERIYTTTNFGQTWVVDNGGSGSSTLYRIRFTDNMTGFACGSQGTILKREPLVVADFYATPTTACAGTAINFYDNSTGDIDTWSWTFEGGTPPTSTVPNPTVTYSAAGTYDVQLTVTSGSANSTELKTDYITVYQGTGQPVTPAGPAEACGTYSYQYLTHEVIYASSYDWQVNPSSAGTMSGNDTVATFLASNTWSGAYSIRVRAQSDCGYGPWSQEITGTLYHDPVQYTLTGDGFYCEGDPGSEIILDGSETGVNYELYKDEVSTGIVMPGTGTPLNFGIFTETGIYNCSAYTDHCSENMVGEIYVHVVPVPEPSVTGPSTVCDNAEGEYSTPENAGDSYSWDVAGGTVVTGAGTWQINVLWGVPGPGSVSVTETTQQGCEAISETLDVTIDDCTGIAETETPSLHIYPNPTTGLVTISGADQKTIKIFDIFGQELISFISSNNYQNIDLTNFNKGIYIIKIQQSQEHVFRLIKQ